MTSIVLRDYQSDLIARTRRALAMKPRVLMQLPTGGGKTACAAHMVGGSARNGHRVIFAVHRAELLRQTCATFDRQDIAHGVIAAGHGYNPHHQIHVASIQTLARRLDVARRPDVLVIDEAHHMAAASWSAVAKALRPRWTIGLSATPSRLDGRGLSDHFDEIVSGPAVRDLIDAGHLADFRVFAPTTIDMSGARTTGGDWNRADAEERADKPAIIGDVVEHYTRLARGKRAVAFCVSIKHAEHVVEQFRSCGIAAAHVDGKMDPAARANTLAAFEAGRILVLASVDLVSEGFDLPAIEAAILLRPTQSLALYIQQVGRVLRPSPGKAEAIILDHVGATSRHGFVDEPREWSLTASRKKSSGKAGDSVPTRTCPDCYRIHRPAPVCPACGHVYAVVGRMIEEREGELEEVERGRILDDIARKRAKADAMRQARSLSDFQRIAADFGHKSGWAWHAWQHSRHNPGRQGRAA